MDDEDLRDLFAFGAMISKAWQAPNLEHHAKNCYAIADAMFANSDASEALIAPLRSSANTCDNWSRNSDTFFMVMLLVV